MNAATRRRTPAAVFFSLALAAITLGLPATARAEADCRDGHQCTVNGQPGTCGEGNGACYCYMVGGPSAEKEPACNTTEN